MVCGVATLVLATPDSWPTSMEELGHKGRPIGEFSVSFESGIVTIIDRRNVRTGLVDEIGDEGLERQDEALVVDVPLLIGTTATSLFASRV